MRFTKLIQILTFLISNIFMFNCKIYLDPNKKRVLLIGIDAMYKESLKKTESSIIKYMMQEGSYTLNARTAYEAVSACGWSNILCGMDTEDTGITNNDWYAPWLYGGKVMNITPVTGPNEPFPCIFSELKKNRKDANIKVSWDWDWLSLNLGNLSMPGSIDKEDYCEVEAEGDAYSGYFKCDIEMLQNTINNIKSDFDFMFVYFGSVDETGHVKGFDSPDYLNALTNVNKYLEMIFEELKSSGIFENTYIFIVTDHGVQPLTQWHGEWNDVNIQLPLFFKGPNIRKNYLIETNVRNIDIPATILNIFGYEANSLWRSRVIKEMFVNENKPEKEGSKLYKRLMKNRMKQIQPVLHY